MWAIKYISTRLIVGDLRFTTVDACMEYIYATNIATRRSGASSIRMEPVMVPAR